MSEVAQVSNTVQWVIQQQTALSGRDGPDALEYLFMSGSFQAPGVNYQVCSLQRPQMGGAFYASPGEWCCLGILATTYDYDNRIIKPFRELGCSE